MVIAPGRGAASRRRRGDRQGQPRWFTGGEQRFASGLVDRYVADDVAQIRQQVAELLQQGLPAQPRSQQAELFLQHLARLDAEPQIEPSVVRDLYQGERP